jgi:glycosyltransferase involved in cell wall biosynthesis
MRVCFVSDEIFHWGRYGGFGSLTRTIGGELAKKGIEVFVVMPRSSLEQRSIEKLDGMTILSVPSKRHYFSLSTALHSGRFFKLCDADIFHSEEPTVGTYAAIKAEPTKKHIITFQDPRDLNTSKMMWALDISGYRKNAFHRLITVNYRRIENLFIKKAAHKADLLSCQAKYIIPKTTNMYDLKRTPQFLPNPVRIPANNGEKAKEPTVCFVARLDRVKQPELFFELARSFPKVKFVVAGSAHSQERNRYLTEISKNINNLECLGFVDEETKSSIFKKSWIYVNTSIRECLPVAFLEAAAHKCAILSSENPDDFAENFGYQVKDNNLAGYIEGLSVLLTDDLWKAKGENGYRYVKEVHEMDKVVNQHINIYQELAE